MRHSRSADFAAALDTADRRRWSDGTHDPNGPMAIAHRARTLQAAWMPQIPDRIRFLVDRCRGKNVLDIGCVAHESSRFDDPGWLHRHIAEAADSCIGVDVLDEDVALMRSAGYDAVAHDLSTGLGPIAARAPFDVIVAGELIEHVGNLDFLFTTARDCLSRTGQLILTTPNPYAPARVRAGQRGVVWENADHVAYLFPSGAAELSERHGLVLTGATTVADRMAERAEPLRALKRAIRASAWKNVGYDTAGDRCGHAAVRPGLRHRLPLVRRDRFLGETFVYVIQLPGRG